MSDMFSMNLPCGSWSNRGAVIQMLPFWHFMLGTQGENLLHSPSQASGSPVLMGYNIPISMACELPRKSMVWGQAFTLEGEGIVFRTWKRGGKNVRIIVLESSESNVNGEERGKTGNVTFIMCLLVRREDKKKDQMPFWTNSPSSKNIVRIAPYLFVCIKPVKPNHIQTIYQTT